MKDINSFLYEIETWTTLNPTSIEFKINLISIQQLVWDSIKDKWNTNWWKIQFRIVQSMITTYESKIVLPKPNLMNDYHYNYFNICNMSMKKHVLTCFLISI